MSKDFIVPVEDYDGPDEEPRQSWRVLVAPWGEAADFRSRREARKYAKAHLTEIKNNWDY